MSKKQVDLTPTPRLLSVVGKIPLAGWQCIAELLDNSLDAMIKKYDSDSNLSNKIRITLPSKLDIENNIPLVIRDNGLGMNEKQLVSALTAGMSGKTSDGDLGLFGMGFNIATSRLAKSTTVWTSTAESDHDIGININIPEMIKNQSFVRDFLTRNNSETSAKGMHGTTIEIKDYLPDAQNLLYRPKLIRNLKSVYSSIIKQKYNIDIKATAKEGWVSIEPKRFCIWDERRTVNHRDEGEIKPIYKFDNEISQSPYCTRCLCNLDANISNCPICDGSDTIITKKFNVRGWLGIQRYFSEEEYGFDIVRNGRIIKEWDKTLFTWNDRKKIHESITRIQNH